MSIKRLDVSSREGGAGREKAYFEQHKAAGVRLRRKYTPAGQQVKQIKANRG